MTAYNIQSQVADTGGVNLVIDIRGAANEPIAKGRALDPYQPTGRQNQLWTLVPAGSGWFTIQSNLTGVDSAEPLVIDIEGAGKATAVARGTKIDVFTPTGNDNQLWKFVDDIPGNAGWYVIQSKLPDAESGEPLVIDITGGSNALGTPLPVWTQNNGPNQLWMLAG
jgi:Ricin-type beta-trefoil lectin domain-like